jgi:polar amino acid transport system substrate-binding protein
MRIGVAESPPWVRTWTGEPSGVEPNLLRGFAQTLSARVEWIRGGETELFAALQAREVDVVLSGITTDSPWTEKLAATMPYVTTRTVVASKGDAPSELSGLQILVRRGDASAASLRSDKAKVISVDAVRASHAPVVAVEEWRATALGYHPTNTVLDTQKHVLLVPPGENGWLLALD